MLNVSLEKVKEFMKESREIFEDNQDVKVGAYITGKNELILYATLNGNKNNLNYNVDLRKYCNKKYYTLITASNDAYKDIENMIEEYIVNDCIETEMNEGCHDDYIEDYKTPLDFYLSSVEMDNYIDYLGFIYGIDEEYSNTIQLLVIEKIKEKYNNAE